MRSYGDPSGRSLPPIIRGMYKVAEIGQRLGVMPSTADLISKQSHAARQIAHPGWWMTYRVNPTVRTEELTISGRSGPIRIRAYWPVGTGPEVTEPAPVVLYLHGGGFMLGGIEACAWICGEIAAKTPAVVAAVEYRLAPEHPFPAGLDDCRDALDWLADGGLRGTDPTRIAVAGDSAGGNLTAALCLQVRLHGGPAIAHQTLVYPFLDSKLRGQSWRDCAGGGVDLTSGKMMVDAYGGDERDNPLVSPLQAEDLSGLPPALICTSDYDVLRDDGFAYADALRAAGVPVRHSNYVRVPHGLLSMPRLLPVAHQMIAEISDEIARHLARPPAVVPPQLADRSST
jgi:acetyl esterase